MDANGTMLVTGANGFIGGWLAETLSLRGCAQVRAGVHTWSGAARIARFPIDIVCCDVLDTESVQKAVEGQSCVIHCAVGDRSVIVDGTQNMLEAALAAGVDRFVYLSTCEVYGQVSGEFDEHSPCVRTGNAYADAKIDAEALCWQYWAKGLPVTVVRAPIVYGPYSTDWTVRLAQRLRSGNWGTFHDNGNGICNLTYVTDLVDGVLKASVAPAAAGEAFNLNGPDTLTWNEYFSRLNSALGLPDLRVVSPQSAKLRSTFTAPLRSGAKFVLRHLRDPLRKLSQQSPRARLAMQRAERFLVTPPRTDELGLYSRKAVYLSSKAEKTFGYKPRVGIADGLRLSTLWLEHSGLLT